MHCTDGPIIQRAEKVTNYAWSNEKTKVKIYVPLEGCGEIPEENVSLVSAFSTKYLSVLLVFLAKGSNKAVGGHVTHVPT